MRHRWIAAVAGLALSLGTIGVLSPPAAAQGRQKLTITVGGEGMHLFPLYVARGAGFFAEEGLEVDWVHVGSGTRQAASVMGGSAEMTPLALFHVVKASAEGGSLVAFASIFDVYAMTIVLSNEAIQKTGITPTLPIAEKVRRLEGLRLGISSPGSSTDLMIRNLFRARNMDPDKMVKLLPFGNGPALMAAFEKKLSDGFVYIAPYPEIAQLRGLGKIVINPFTGEIPELKDVPYVIIATTRDTLRKRPELIQAATRALTKAMVFAHEKPAETRKLMRPYFPELDEPVYNLIVEMYRKATPRTPVISAEQLAKTVAWMNLGAPKPTEAKYDAVVTVEAAQRAAAQILKR